MNNIKIRRLLDSFADNYVPAQVRAAFASWLLGKEDSEEKEAALEEIWDEMSLEKEKFEFDELLPGSSSILADAKNVEKPVAARKLRKYRAMSYAFGAFAAICAVLCVFFYSAKRGDATTVLVATVSKVYYELPDGSSVWLNKNSKLCFKNNLEGKRRELSLEGEAFFDVAKDPEHPFVIRTSNMNVKVLGTRFTMRAYSDSPEQVFLESGKVSLSSEHFPDDVLSPGEAFSYDPISETASHFKEKTVNHLSWTNEQLVFANASLADIIANLEHWYNVRIDNTGKPAEERLSLVVRQETLPDVLAAIHRLTGRTYTINGNEITIN